LNIVSNSVIFQTSRRWQPLFKFVLFLTLLVIYIYLMYNISTLLLIIGCFAFFFEMYLALIDFSRMRKFVLFSDRFEIPIKGFLSPSQKTRIIPIKEIRYLLISTKPYNVFIEEKNGIVTQISLWFIKNKELDYIIKYLSGQKIVTLRKHLRASWMH